MRKFADTQTADHRRPQYSGRSVISIKQKKNCF